MAQLKLNFFTISIGLAILMIIVAGYVNVHIDNNNDNNIGKTIDDHEVCNETETVNPKRIKEVTPAEVPPTSFSVIFDNQSGKRVELYWDDGADGILQSEMKHNDQITINTYIGHKFYFTDKFNKKNKLYSTIMYEHIGYVTLYNEREMKERDRQFELKKQEFFKEYYQNTGLRWGNYYPRQPVKHYHYNFTHIGQKIQIKSKQTFFYKCNETDIPNDIKNKLIEQENNWLNENNVHSIDQIHPFNETYNDNDNDKNNKGNFANVGGMNPLPSYTDKSNKYHITRWNQTFYCRNIVNTEENENNNNNAVKPMEFEMEVLCTKPKVSRILNFISDEEINAIKNSGLYNGMKRSTVSESALVSLDRTSATVWIDRSDSNLIDNVIRRIADVIKIDESKLYLNASSESLQLVHYFPGEMYKSHVDYGTDRPHNRYITFLIYLNDVKQGGYTSFPKASQECKDKNGYFGVKPEKGSVAWFYDLLPDGNVDVLSQHFAEPPINSEKWMSNLWVWDEVFSR